MLDAHPVHLPFGGMYETRIHHSRLCEHPPNGLITVSWEHSENLAEDGIIEIHALASTICFQGSADTYLVYLPLAERTRIERETI
jgi:hypothetical protein